MTLPFVMGEWWRLPELGWWGYLTSQKQGREPGGWCGWHRVQGRMWGHGLLPRQELSDFGRAGQGGRVRRWDQRHTGGSRELGVGAGPPGVWTGESRTQRPRILAGSDADSVEQRDRRSNESLLITVLWRRLSMFSRRGSARSTRRQAVQNPKRASRIQERDQEMIQEEPEKG